MAKEVMVLHYNHFDPTWRRCFDRPSTYNGVTVRSYAEIEEHCINAFLALAGRGVTFVEGQAAVLRKYLQRNPDRRARLAELARSGQLALIHAGEVIQDSNLPAAEGVVRNFLVAQDIYQELLGDVPPSVAMVDDAFGNGPNMPQVFRLVGCDMVNGITYRACPRLRWQGIDGSWVYVGDHRPKSMVGDFAKQPPCPACRGQGCPECDNTGVALIPGFDLAAVAAGLDKAVADERPWVELDIFTEELRPDPKVADLVEQYRARYAGKCDIRWGSLAETLARWKAEMAERAAAEPLEVIDLNPAMGGCYVSRIAVKQRARAVAYKLLAAEAELANATWRAGAPAALPEEFAPAWRNLVFTQFHDAITGTHIDSACAEITEMQNAAEAVAQQHLPRQARKGGAGKFSSAEGGRGVKQWGKLRVEFDRVGIVTLLCDGQDLLGQPAPHSRLCRPLRVGELTLEADFGDAWGTRLPPFTEARHDHSLVNLGDYNESVEVAANGIRWRGRYTGGDPLVKKLAWTVTACPSPDRRRLEFTTQVNWDTCSKRLRVVVPVASVADSATYEVPFGFIERKFDPAALNYSQWQGNDMSWPTLHWANARLDERRGVAVLNRGLPCYRWFPGRFDISLLRSPQWQFCSVETGSYEFWDIDGQRDAGKHTLEYAIWPYTDGASEGDLTRAGYEYNMLYPIRLPFGLEGDVVVTAWKPAQDGQGWIVRLQEASGRDGGQVGLLLGKPRSVAVVDLLERPLEPPQSTGHFQRTLHRHEILTVRIGL